MLKDARIKKIFEFFDPTYCYLYYLCSVKINKYCITFKKLKIMIKLDLNGKHYEFDSLVDFIDEIGTHLREQNPELSIEEIVQKYNILFE